MRVSVHADLETLYKQEREREERKTMARRRGNVELFGKTNHADLHEKGGGVEKMELE